MGFTAKAWQNYIAGGTQVDAPGLIDMERRLGTSFTRLIVLGSQGSPCTSDQTASFNDANGYATRDLYVVIYVGANINLQYTNVPSEPCSLVWEVHHVGGPWTPILKDAYWPGGQQANTFSLNANAIDIVSMFSPEGVGWRAMMSNDWLV